MDKLIQEISIDKGFIKETLAVLREALLRSDKTIIELSAIGSFLHHSYNGIENIFKRILKLKKSSFQAHQLLIRTCWMWQQNMG